MRVKSYLLVISFFVLIAPLSAQQPIGGPYQVDSSTVLLLHFDDNYENSSPHSGKAVSHGKTSFVTEGTSKNFGHQLRINNESSDYKSYLEIADTSALDLKGNWVIEMWIKPQSFYDYQMLIYKPTEAYHNYYINIKTIEFNGRQVGELESGYSHNSGSISIHPKKFLNADKWYHLTFIRDTVSNTLVQLIHQNKSNPAKLPETEEDSLKLIYQDAMDFWGENPTGAPVLSNEPLIIGGTVEGHWNNFNGYMEEIRIKNKIGKLPIKPAIKNVTDLDNQNPGTSYPIKSEVISFGDSKLTSVKLHYRINNDAWQTQPMSETSNDMYTAEIPEQTIGTEVRYYITAENNQGKRRKHPTDQKLYRDYYKFGVWEDSTRISHLNFENVRDGEVPEDKTEYDIPYHTKSDLKYEKVDIKGLGNVLRFTQSDYTYLQSESPLLEFKEFMVDVTFKPTGNPPLNEQPLVVKGGDSLYSGGYSYYLHNYQMWIHNNQALVNAEINEYGPSLLLPSEWYISDQKLEPGQWYRLLYSYRMDTMRAHLYSVPDSSYLGGMSKVYRVHKKAVPNSGPFRVGYAGKQHQYQFEGLMDNIKIYNYVPEKLKKDYTAIPSERNVDLNHFKLFANYPNPFNPSTKIEFTLPQVSSVQLDVFNVKGQKVEELIDGRRRAGRHTVRFDGEGLSSGVYFFRLKTDVYSKTRKMMFLK